MGPTNAALLGALQGITEFLPVSSSGHLAVFGIEDIFTITLFHFGTLLSILVYYRRDLVSVGGGGVRLLGAFARAAAKKESIREYLKTDVAARLALLICISMVPTVIVGFALKGLAGYAAREVKIVGACFIVTGLLLFFVDRLALTAKGIGQGRWRDAALIGTFQGIAAMPGLSRSGFTVSAALLCGFDRRDAARYSFLLASPTIFGVSLYEVYGKMKEGGHVDLEPAIIGGIFAFAFGYLAIALLIRILSSYKLHYFTGYLVALGIFVLIWR